MNANAIETLREAVDTLAGAYSDYNKCPLCPLPVDSVCVPNCGAWKTSREALADVEALLEGVKAICAEPTTTGLPHDKATRVTSYRALREILEPLVRRVETGQ